MSEDAFARQRHRVVGEKTALSVPYTAKDFQLEVLDRLEQMQSLAQSLGGIVEPKAPGRQGAAASEV